MKHRSYKVLRGTARRYATTDAHLPFNHPNAWEQQPYAIIPLVLHTDSITRVLDKKVQTAQEVLKRPEVTVLVCLYGSKPYRTYIAIHTDDWQIWEQRVKAIGDPAVLPPLRYDRHNRA